jgi:tetratricopeptide (TPR) repeat protein
LALALNQREKWGEAAAIFSRIAPGRPEDTALQAQFALALRNSGKTREAMSHYAHALLRQPDLVEALDGLAWILATDSHADYRNGKEAVPMAEKACELTGHKDAEKLRTLAAAYAEAGQFAQAVETIQQAKDVAEKSGRKELAGECGKMLERFRLQKPWREEL